MADEKNTDTGGCGCSGDTEPSTPGSYENMLPKVTFSTFVLSLSSSAMVQLGEVPDPDSGQMVENIPVAKHTIDVLAMLKDKTSKCLDEDEARLLEGLLYELRLKYVMKTKK